LYFRSKQEIFLAALRQGIRQLQSETAARVKAANGLRAKIEIFIRCRVEYFEQNRDFFLIYHAEIGDVLVHPAKQGGEVAEMYFDQVRLLEGVLREAAAQGELAQLRPESAAFTICDMARGLSVQRLLGWSKATLEEDIQQVIAMIWKGISR
jgi:AcrR family transcriptional regulator